MNLNFDKIFIPLIFCTLITGTIGCTGKKTETATSKGKGGMPNTLHAEGYIVKTEVFQNDYSASGSLLPNEEIEIHPEITGRVTQIQFKEGTHVRKGQILVQLNDADISASCR
jgi:membrane fusion protein (multidrug efflux system)